jgi:hypothetical protein
MAAAGVLTTAKHFPGLGRVRGNTDDVAQVRRRTRRACSLLGQLNGLGESSVASRSEVEHGISSTVFRPRRDDDATTTVRRVGA